MALAACASQRPVTASAPSASPGNVAATASAAPRADKEFKPPADYRRVMVDGEEKFCRKYWLTGTHAESQTECLTERELKERMEATRTMLEDQMRSRGAIPGGISPAGLGH
jgi:hypothetical protein